MFNTRLKKELQAREAELSVYKQMEKGMDAQMLSVILDSSFRITYANANFLRTLGYTAERLVGLGLDEIVPAYVSSSIVIAICARPSIQASPSSTTTVSSGRTGVWPGFGRSGIQSWVTTASCR